MIYILIFIACCLLDWKLDTYAFFKVLIFPILLFITIGISLIFYDSQAPLKPIGYEQTFISSNITKRGLKSDITEFSYITKSGVQKIETNEIIEVKQSKENKIAIYEKKYPKSAKILFFLPNETKYKVYLK